MEVDALFVKAVLKMFWWSTLLSTIFLSVRQWIHDYL